jgi:hypothetical protein
MGVRKSRDTPVVSRTASLRFVKDVLNAALSRSLFSCPFDTTQKLVAPWSPPVKQNGEGWRTCVKDSILGGQDEEFCEIMRTEISHYIEGEVLSETELGREADLSEITIDTAASSLVEDAPALRLKGEDFADILCGLNVICNESLEPRRVKQELSGCLRSVIQGQPGHDDIEGPKAI